MQQTLHLDTATGNLSTSAGGQLISQLTAKLGTALDLEIFPNADLAHTATARLVARPNGLYSAQPVAYAGEWTPPTSDIRGYKMHLGLDTEELALLYPGETPNVDLMLELSIESTWTTIKSQTVLLHVPRTLWRGDEQTPTPAFYPAPVVQFIDDVPSSKIDFFMFPNAEAPTTGLFQASDSRYIYTIKGGWNFWRRTPIATW